MGSRIGPVYVDSSLVDLGACAFLGGGNLTKKHILGGNPKSQIEDPSTVPCNLVFTVGWGYWMSQSFVCAS